MQLNLSSLYLPAFSAPQQTLSSPKLDIVPSQAGAPEGRRDPVDNPSNAAVQVVTLANSASSISSEPPAGTSVNRISTAGAPGSDVSIPNEESSAGIAQQALAPSSKPDEGESEAPAQSSGETGLVAGEREEATEQNSASGSEAEIERGESEAAKERAQAQVELLQARDQEVRAHERAHQAAGGQYAGAASYSYQTGPDGKRYAVSGEVPIDVAAVPGNPQQTIDKMRTVRAAALAPADPSPQDRSVAAAAMQILLGAQAELASNARRNIDESSSSESEAISPVTKTYQEIEGLVDDEAPVEQAFEAIA